jgi:hypothetical protein
MRQGYAVKLLKELEQQRKAKESAQKASREAKARGQAQGMAQRLLRAGNSPEAVLHAVTYQHGATGRLEALEAIRKRGDGVRTSRGQGAFHRTPRGWTRTVVGADARVLVAWSAGAGSCPCGAGRT